MKKCYLFILILLSTLSCTDKAVKEIIVCGDDKALIIDVEKSDGKDIHTVWSWKVSDAISELPDVYQKYMIPLDECKSVDKGNKILLTSSGGGVLLLDRNTKKCLFHAYAPMAHSAEWLPDNRIVVALSTHKQGNCVELYDIGKSEQPLFRDSIYSGHGVVWLNKKNRLYALGFNEIRSYSLENWKSDNPRLKLEKIWKTSSGGHDLLKVTETKLLYTAHDGVFWFDTDKEDFFPFPPLQHKKNVKSLNFVEKNNFMVYTQAEIDWWTHNIYIENPSKILTIDDINLYKVRTINSQ